MNSTTQISRNWWSKQEDEILQKEANLQLDRGSLRDWNLIASRLPGRTNKDCRKRWTKLSKQINKGSWDAEEDDALRKAIHQFGLKWTLVSKGVATRSADQCAKRWQHYLDPNIDHSSWRSEDDERLLRAVDVYGRNWKTISNTEFPRRSTTDLKNRYVAAEKRRKHSIASVTSSITSVSSPATTLSACGEELLHNLDMAGTIDDFSIEDLDIPSLDHAMSSSSSSYNDRHSSLKSEPQFVWPDGIDPLTQFANSPENFSEMLSMDPTSSSFAAELAEGSEVPPEVSINSLPAERMMPSQNHDDMCMTDNSEDTTGGRSTLVLEDLEPGAVSEIMHLMLQRNIRMKMRLEPQG